MNFEEAQALARKKGTADYKKKKPAVASTAKRIVVGSLALAAIVHVGLIFRSNGEHAAAENIKGEKQQVRPLEPLRAQEEPIVVYRNKDTIVATKEGHCQLWSDQAPVSVRVVSQQGTSDVIKNAELKPGQHGSAAIFRIDPERWSGETFPMRVTHYPYGFPECAPYRPRGWKG